MKESTKSLHYKIDVSKSSNFSRINPNLKLSKTIIDRGQREKTEQSESLLTEFFQKYSKDYQKYTQELPDAIIKMRKKTHPNLPGKEEIKNSQKKESLESKETEIETEEEKQEKKRLKKLTKKAEREKTRQRLFSPLQSKPSYETKTLTEEGERIFSENIVIDGIERDNLLNMNLPVKNRICSYQPKVDTNWKFIEGLKLVASDTKSFIGCLMKDVEFQSKALEDHVKLLLDNLNYYKSSGIINDEFTMAFKFLPIHSKIKYNKTLEELIGILYLVPQLLLNEFFAFIEKFNTIQPINKNKLKPRIVHDECKMMLENNSLLSDVMAFFSGCFDTYKTLCREVDGMLFNQKKFQNIVTVLEKGRYDASNLVTMTKNTTKNFKMDTKLIDDVMKNAFRKPIFQTEESNFNKKFQNQYNFKLNEERQRIMRIQGSLKPAEPFDEYEARQKKINGGMKKQFKSIMETNLLNKIYRYCTKEAQHNITATRILSEFDENLD
ncbi:MAG: hypothetical protein MJ252_08115 [archaeon]|nr:hypothetical protein [archaeon]